MRDMQSALPHVAVRFLSALSCCPVRRACHVQCSSAPKHVIRLLAQVLLLGGSTNISGYAAQGSLYTGAGYWSPGPDLPYQLSDMSVRLRPHLPACSP